MRYYIEEVRSVATDLQLLFASKRVRLPTPVRYCNMDRFNKSFSDTTLQFFYCAREADLAPVHLARTPRDTLLYGQEYLLRCGEVLIKEQIPWWLQGQATWPSIIDKPVEVVDVEDPCLLIARYGAATWGHWLGELLPAIVACEHANPKTFKYVLPAQITMRTEKRSYSTSVFESLAAYGITEDRLIKVGTAGNYRFSTLFLLTQVWSSGVMRPEVAELMRSKILGVTSGTPDRRIALTRREERARSIVNPDPVYTFLAEEGFEPVDIAGLSFIEQVNIFQGATDVFSVLGSDLSGLIYAPDKVRVVSAAPGDWSETFFYALMQLRDATYADIRGTPVQIGDGGVRVAKFNLDLDDLRTGLRAVREQASRNDSELLEIGGAVLPQKIGNREIALSFREGGNAASFLDIGWSHQERVFIWSVGDVCRIVLPPLKSAGDHVLECIFHPFAEAPDALERVVTVDVNERQIGSFLISQRCRLFCVIPADALQNQDALRLEFRHPIIAQSKNDPRPLGLAFYEVNIWPAETAQSC